MLAGAASSKAQAKIRIWDQRWPPRRCAASRATISQIPIEWWRAPSTSPDTAAADGGRDYDPVFLSEAQLRNVYFPPFQAAVKAGVGTFMSAYMDLNNVPASGNRWLLHDVLRGEWGFAGFVVSDAMAIGNLVIQGYARDRREAALRALQAGLNMDMASNTYLENLAELVNDGSLSMDQIDEMVRPILTIKVRMGLFEHPYVDEGLLEKVIALPEHRQAARLAAQRSMVLLRNEGGLLPLAKNLKNVAVIGPLADSMEATEGSWMVFGHQPAAVTVLQGIRAKLPGANSRPTRRGRRFAGILPPSSRISIPAAKKPDPDARRRRGRLPDRGGNGARRGPGDHGAGRERRHGRRVRLTRHRSICRGGRKNCSRRLARSANRSFWCCSTAAR